MNLKKNGQSQKSKDDKKKKMSKKPKIKKIRVDEKNTEGWVIGVVVLKSCITIDNLAVSSGERVWLLFCNKANATFCKSWVFMLDISREPIDST